MKSFRPFANIHWLIFVDWIHQNGYSRTSPDSLRGLLDRFALKLIPMRAIDFQTRPSTCSPLLLSDRRSQALLFRRSRGPVIEKEKTPGNP